MGHGLYFSSHLATITHSGPLPVSHFDNRNADLRPIIRFPIPIIIVTRHTAHTQTPSSFTYDHPILRIASLIAPSFPLYIRLVGIHTS
jgi:hypothetical protein